MELKWLLLTLTRDSLSLPYTSLPRLRQLCKPLMVKKLVVILPDVVVVEVEVAEGKSKLFVHNVSEETSQADIWNVDNPGF